MNEKGPSCIANLPSTIEKKGTRGITTRSCIIVYHSLGRIAHHAASLCERLVLSYVPLVAGITMCPQAIPATPNTNHFPVAISSAFTLEI